MRKMLVICMLSLLLLTGMKPAEPARAFTGLEIAKLALQSAGVPEELWQEFLAVSYCESRFNPSAIGRLGESARGLYQIHWDLWAPWAEDNGYGEFPIDGWDNPVLNTSLAYLIGEHYNMPRYGDRWEHQWDSQAEWDECYEWRSK